MVCFRWFIRCSNELRTIGLYSSDSQRTERNLKPVLSAPKPVRDRWKNSLHQQSDKAQFPRVRMSACVLFTHVRYNAFRLILHSDQPGEDSQSPRNHPDPRSVCRLLIAYRSFVDICSEREAARYEMVACNGLSLTLSGTGVRPSFL